MAWFLPAILSTIGVGTSLYGSSQASKSAREAARRQQDAANISVRDQAAARDETRQVLTPYSKEGQAARTSYNALLGIKTAGGPTGAAAAAFDPFEQYVRSQPDLMAEYQRLQTGKSTGVVGSISDFGRMHYETYGQNEGRVLPANPNAAPEMTEQDLDAARKAAYAGYGASPYAEAGRLAVEGANRQIMGAAGASGSVLSGRTTNALFNANQTYNSQAMLGYLDQLSGVAGRGYEADTNIAGAGQNYANNAGSIRTGVATASGNALAQAGQAQQQGAQDAANILAFTIGQYGRPAGTSGAPTTTTGRTGTYNPSAAVLAKRPPAMPTMPTKGARPPKIAPGSPFGLRS